jgi:hypothetical protein
MKTKKPVKKPAKSKPKPVTKQKPPAKRIPTTRVVERYADEADHDS